MNALGGCNANELTFQNDMLKHLVAKGWLLGKAAHYNRDQTLSPEDLQEFAQDIQPEQWQKTCALYPCPPELNFLDRVASKLKKKAPNVGSVMRAFCSVPVLDHCEPVKALTA